MNILLVKTSSLGDIVHTFPAVTDAARAFPNMRLDWVVEEAFTDLCRRHRAVTNVVPVAYRRWRRRPIEGIFGGALNDFRRGLREIDYDAVIDAQGLYKSAVITAMANGRRCGFDLLSCREKLAPLAYQHKFRVPQNLHAIDRYRQLFASALGYALPDGGPDYGLDTDDLPRPTETRPYILFLHGGGWRTKEWPVQRWRETAKIAAANDFIVCAPWHNAADRRRAGELAVDLPNVITPEAHLNDMIALVAQAAAVVTLETGFGHLAAAFRRPTVSLYGPTGPRRHGTLGFAQQHVCADWPCSPCHNKICNYISNERAPAPCMSEIAASRVWQALTQAMAETSSGSNLAT